MRLVLVLNMLSSLNKDIIIIIIIKNPGLSRKFNFTIYSHLKEQVVQSKLYQLLS